MGQDQTLDLGSKQVSMIKTSTLNWLYLVLIGVVVVLIGGFIFIVAKRRKKKE